MKIRNATTLAVVLAIAVLAVFIVVPYVRSRNHHGRHDESKRLPYRLVDVFSAETAPFLPILVADVDGDGDDDLVVNEPERLLWYRLHESGVKLEREYRYERPAVTLFVADVNQDGRAEFLVFTDTPRGPMLECHSWFGLQGPSVPLYSIGPMLERAVGPRIWRRIDYFGCFTPYRQGPPLNFLALNTITADSAPRSVLAWNGATGRQIWRRELGPQIQGLAFGDLGVQPARIVFTTVAVRPGVEVNVAMDSLCAVFCLEATNGKTLWTRAVGRRGARAEVAVDDFDGDGKKEIAILRHLDENDPTRNEAPAWNMAALDAGGAMLRHALVPGNPLSMHTVHIASQASPRLLVEERDGDLAILDSRFAITDSIVPPPAFPQFPRISSVWQSEMRGPGKQELVYAIENAILVRDLRGKILARRKFGPYLQARLAHYDGKDHVFTTEHGLIRLVKLERPPMAERIRAYSRALVIGAALAVLIGAWGTFHTRRLLKRRRERGLDLSEQQSDLLTAMSAFGHGGSSLRVLDRIRFHLKNWERIPETAEPRQERLARLNQTFSSTVEPELEQLVMLARRARVPEEHWDTLLPRARVAREQMEAALACGPEAEAQRNDHLARALGALDAIDALIAGIRLHLRSVYRTPIVPALEGLIARFKDEYEDRGMTFSLATDPSADAVFVSPFIFDKVFECLLANAVRATEGKTDAAIAVVLQCEGNYCRIDVGDNGCGIPSEDWEKMFERHYTTRPEGGGFGLYYAREQLAKFGGKIHVVDSVVGSGTTMRVVLRRSEKAVSA